MSNPVQTFAGSVDGIWLVPYTSTNQPATGKEAWIGASHPSSERERSHELFTSPSRAEEVSQSGELHLERGAINGILPAERHGLTAHEWLRRLENLIANQHKYVKIRLTSARDDFSVELTTGLSKEPAIYGGQGWNVSVPFRRLSEK